jgi:hemerythrin-like domain-containing protein
MELESLIRTLVDEHVTMRKSLRKARDAAEKRDFGALTEILRGLDSIFRQHIVDEESQILRLLIGSLGVKEAQEEIRVFQQHTPIYQLMQKIAEFASKSATELEKEQSSLELLLAEHTEAEESRVFPMAISCSEGVLGL